MTRGTVVFVSVTLARPAACDTCAHPLPRGARAHLLVGAPRGRRFRCAECFAAGREPEGAASTALAVAEPGEGTRRAVVTLAVAAKAAGRWILSRLFPRRARRRVTAPQAVRQAFEELGPTYVKLGQLVASSQGLFPEAYCKELQKCLDRVAPFGFAEVERTLKEELGRPAAQIFADIDPVPLASASIAQVHAARLATGEDVVVKVQRPGIAGILAADLRVLRVIARLVSLVPSGELANPVGIVEDFEANLREELDFVREAGNMLEFNRIMREHHQTEVVAPRPQMALTTRRVLVMERFYGCRVDDVERLRANGADGEEKLLTGMRAWFQCMMFHGFFHGDVHAGNLMALDDGRIGFLDFGIVGRFDAARRAQITDYLFAFASGDFKKLAEVMVAMGSVGADVDLPRLAKDLEAAYEPLVGAAAASVKYADLLPAILRVSVEHGMRMPRDFVLISKQMLYFDRYAKVLAPNLNIFRDPRIVTAMAADVLASKMLG